MQPKLLKKRKEFPLSSLKKNQEQELIDKIKDWTGSTKIGDDCAVLPGGSLASVDTLVDGVHFRTGSISFRDLGWKAVAVNLSDIAAMAGRPRHILVSISAPASLAERALAELYRGISECARSYRVEVAGGDLTGGPVLSISITALGEVHEQGVLLRSGARPGDLLVCTGDFGASAAGLHLLEQGESGGRHTYVIERHCRPVPRLCEAWALLRACGGRGALMDASDGLADAVIQLAMASGVSIELEAEKVPVHQECIEIAGLAGFDPLDWALYGGEDYELVGCIDRNSFAVLESYGKLNPFHVLGFVNSITKETELNLSSSAAQIRLDDNRLVELDGQKSFQHFENKPN